MSALRVPQTVDGLKPMLPQFSAWLTARGAGLISTTNEWEVLRFKTAKTTAVIYRRAGGSLTFTGGAKEAVRAFCANDSWRAGPATKRAPQRRIDPAYRTLRQRDGHLCFFCQEHVDEDVQSIEHLVSVTHRGPNHISNFVLAHRVCNHQAGHMSAMEKIAIHVRAVQAKATGAAA